MGSLNAIVSLLWHFANIYVSQPYMIRVEPPQLNRRYKYIPVVHVLFAMLNLVLVQRNTAPSLAASEGTRERHSVSFEASLYV